jgi:hypothetical protein
LTFTKNGRTATVILGAAEDGVSVVITTD